jgi:hypothetical protein
VAPLVLALDQQRVDRLADVRDGKDALDAYHAGIPVNAYFGGGDPDFPEHWSCRECAAPSLRPNFAMRISSPPAIPT